MSLLDIRNEIDEIDAQLAKLIERRLTVARAAGREKKAQRRPARDLEREHAVIVRYVGIAGIEAVPVARAIIDACVKTQELDDG